MTVQETHKALSAHQKKSGKPFLNKIREFEEVTKGNFSSFVDDGAQSYDVSMSVDVKTKKLKSLTCDCQSRAKMCGHKVAVLEAFVKGQLAKESFTTRRIVANKLTKGEKLLSQIEDDEKILAWLAKKLDQDEVLRLSLENDLLGPPEKLVTAQFLMDRYDESKKAVLGRRKYSSTQEITQVLKLMKPHLSGGLTFAFNNIKNKDSLKLVGGILEVFLLMHYLTDKPTSRVGTFFKKLLAENVKYLPADKEALYEFLRKIAQVPYQEAPAFDLFHLLLEHSGDRLDKDEFATLLTMLIRSRNIDYQPESVTLKYLALAEKYEVLESCSDQLPPLIYKNKYNMKLLEMHMAAGNYTYVIECCKKIIARYTPQYQLPYYHMLLSAAEALGDQDVIFLVFMSMFNSFPSIEILNRIIELEPTPAQKLRLDKLIESNKINSGYSYYEDFIEIKFAYWYRYEQYAKIISKIMNAVTLRQAFVYHEALWGHDYLGYLKAIRKAHNKDGYKIAFSFMVELENRVIDSIHASGGEAFLAGDPALERILKRMNIEVGDRS